MMYLILKALISGAVIAAGPEIARRSSRFAALIAPLPLVSIPGMIWLWRDTADVGRLASHAEATSVRLAV